MKAPTLLEQAEKIAPSLSEQEYRFSRFCVDMLDHTKDGGQVYMDFLKENPTDQEITAAQNLIIKRAEIEKKMPAEVSTNSVRPGLTLSERKAHLLLDLFVHHATSKDTEGALRDAEFKINQDPELQNDKAFRGVVKNAAQRLQGEQKTINKLNLQNHGDNFFHVSKSGPARWHQHVGDAKMKKIMQEAMILLYSSQGKAKPEHLESTVDHIVHHRQVPVAIALAAHENRTALDGIKGEMKNAHFNEHKHVGLNIDDRIKFATERRNNLHPKVKYVNKLGVEFRESSRSATEKMELIRELLKECCTGEESKYMVCRRISDSLKELGAKEELVKMALNFKDVENTEKNRTELLMKAYHICCPDGFKVEGYESSVTRESQQLALGNKTLHQGAVDEVMNNRQSHQHWVHFNEAPQVMKNENVKVERHETLSMRRQEADQNQQNEIPKIEIGAPGKMNFNMGPQAN